MKMKELSFYEQAGLLLPGAILLFGLLLLIPELTPLFIDGGITIGGLGLFLLIAYALGHLVAAAGNLIEAVMWWPAGGKPTTWVPNPRRMRLLTATQHEALLAKVNARLGLGVTAIRGLPKREWEAHFGLLYRDVLNAGDCQRLETFNGNYGLNRGLAAALLALVAVAVIRQPENWLWYVTALAVAFAGYAFRTIRFGLYWAREVYLTFLLLPDKRD